ncbi:MAG: tetratricopeptide repeat protein [Hyphomicrobiaceae bacterium]
MSTLFTSQRYQAGSRAAVMTGLMAFLAVATAVMTFSNSAVSQSARSAPSTSELNARLDDLQDSAQFDDAIAVAERLYALRVAELGVAHPDAGRLQFRIAELYRRTGDRGRAEQTYWQVVEQFSDSSGDDRRLLQTALGHLSLLYLAQNRFDLAGQVTERLNAEVKRAAAAERTRKEQALPMKVETAPVSEQSDTGSVAGQGQTTRAGDQKLRIESPQTPGVQDRSGSQSSDSLSPSAVASIAQPAARMVRGNDTGSARSCGKPVVALSWQPYGYVDILVRSQCRSGQDVRLSYGSNAFSKRFSKDGVVELGLDLFAGRGVAAALSFEDGSSQELNIDHSDTGEHSKVAIVWKGDINLDLHAFEYTAGFNGPGHISAENPGSYDLTLNRVVSEKRGHGFLSSSSDGSGIGSHAEVFTFLHNSKQRYGAVRLALDHRSRGPVPHDIYCGDGAAASVTFDVYVREANGQVTSETGTIPAAACGLELAEQERYIWSAVPDIRFRR